MIIFVNSERGDDAYVGTEEAPVASVQRAVDLIYESLMKPAAVENFLMQ